MIKTEYDIGQIINLPWKVTSITKTENRTEYRLEMPDKANMPWLVMDELQLTDVECISADKYEAEINDLKDEIKRLREMYQLEHIKALKLKSEAHRGMQSDSHHPSINTYSDDWRKMP